MARRAAALLSAAAAPAAGGRAYDRLTATCKDAVAIGGQHNVTSVAECEALCDAAVAAANGGGGDKYTTYAAAAAPCAAVDTNGEVCYLKSACSGTPGPCSGWCAYRAAAAPPAPPPALNQTLRAAGEHAGIYVGSQFKWGWAVGPDSAANQQYASTHSAQYALSTVGNECKWPATQAKQGSFTLDRCVDSLLYAQNAGQVFRGHNLCWGNDNPGWLTGGGFSPEQLRTVLRDHVTSVMQGVGKHGKVLAWDVVNEACNNTGLKAATPWYPAVPDYVDVAFTAARAADPGALLFYNEYGIDAEGKKATAVYNMLKSMQDRGIPVDGVGLQMHLSVSKPPEESSVRRNIARFAALGLQVHITELDVKCPDPCDAATQADVYASVLRACLASPGCTSFETWGFTDKVSWLNGKRCPSGGACHALPFDENYAPKPAAASLLSTLQQHAGRPSALVRGA